MSNEGGTTPASLSEIARIRAAAQERLLKIPGVSAVGIGPKFKRGTPTGELALVVTVAQKKPHHALAQDELVPPVVDGVKTDVITQGPVQALSGGGSANAQPDLEFPEIFGGMKIRGKERGTLGCIVVKEPDDGHFYALTNQHVCFTYNNVAPLGEDVSAAASSACCDERIGVVVDVELLQKVNAPIPVKPNTISLPTDVDAALIKLDPGRILKARAVHEDAYREITGEDDLSALYAKPNFDSDKVQDQNYSVFVYGAFTCTKGLLVKVQVSPNNLQSHTHPDATTYMEFHRQLVVRTLEKGESFAQHGDSGSVVLNEQGQVIGLLWGASPEGRFDEDGYGRGIVTPISAIKERFKIRVATASDLPPVSPVASSSSGSGGASALAGSTPQGAQRSLPGGMSLRSRVQTEFLQTPGGQRYAEIILRHVKEVRGLIESNKRVAVIWNRNGGPMIARRVVEAARWPDQPLPQEIEGRPLQEALQQIFDGLKRYGSPALSADIEAHQAGFVQLGRLSYAQILQQLRATGP